jgi:hypothetical protein
VPLLTAMVPFATEEGAPRLLLAEGVGVVTLFTVFTLMAPPLIVVVPL